MVNLLKIDFFRYILLMLINVCMEYPFLKRRVMLILRNKIKRQIKNIIDHNEKYIQNNRHYVIIIKRSVLDLSYKQCETNLLDLFMKISY